MHSDLEKLIPPQCFDTHIHVPFLKASGQDCSQWKKGAMSTGYFFESGLTLKTLDRIYPFRQKMHAFCLPIAYGPYDPLLINEWSIRHEVNTPRLWVSLRGDIKPKDLPTLKKQLQSSSRIIGLKFYQTYEQKSTTAFLKKALYPALLRLANPLGLIFFIHTNNLTQGSLDFLEAVLKKYSKIAIVLTHAGVPLTSGYSSFSFADQRELKKHGVSDAHIKRDATMIRSYQSKARRMLNIPRLYVNPALLASELVLYAIFSIFAGTNRILYGSDLPYSLISRIRNERKPIPKSVQHIKAIFEGGTLSPAALKVHHQNIVFLLERVRNVLDYLDPKKTATVFKEMLWENPVKLLGAHGYIIRSS